MHSSRGVSDHMPETRAPAIHMPLRDYCAQLCLLAVGSCLLTLLPVWSSCPGGSECGEYLLSVNLLPHPFLAHARRAQLLQHQLSFPIVLWLLQVMLSFKLQFMPVMEAEASVTLPSYPGCSRYFLWWDFFPLLVSPLVLQLVIIFLWHFVDWHGFGVLISAVVYAVAYQGIQDPEGVALANIL